jgi:23S rRNA pseudouridine2605 synthase
MRKSSSNSSRDTKPGGKDTFRKDDGRKPLSKDAKPFKKKNYDGRGPASGDGPSRPSRPYSGRVADGDRSARPATDRKGKFGSSNPGKGDDDRRPSDSRPKRSFDKDDRKGGDRPFGDRPKRSFDKDERKPRRDGDRPFSDRKPRSEGDRPFSDRPKRSFDKDDRKGGDRPFNDRPKRSFDKDDRKPRRDGDKPFGERKPRSEGERPFSDRPKRSFDKDDRKGGDKPFSDRPKRSFDKKDRNSAAGKPRKEFNKDDKKGGDRPFSDRLNRAFDKEKIDVDGKPIKPKADTRPFRERGIKPPDTISFSKDIDDLGPDEGPEQTEKQFKPKKFTIPKKEQGEWTPETKTGKKKRHHHHHDDDEDEEDKEINQKDGPRLEMPLNKYIAHSGECSRRDAAELVKAGKVKVNDELVLDPGHRVKHDDRVTLSGKKLTPTKGMVYILLNKPKGFITTNDDPQGRKTVMELVGNSGVDRLFPVGRLDRDTSGLLLITNDGDLTQKLCHPAFNIKKVYQVTLDKPLTKADFEKIVAGVDLEDGKAIVDEIAYLEKKNELGLEIHSGRNRIVRRIFESLGYVVDKLDRVMYAGLTKKNLPRSKWRYLTEREVVLLKHFKN